MDINKMLGPYFGENIAGRRLIFPPNVVIREESFRMVFKTEDAIQYAKARYQEVYPARYFEKRKTWS